MSKLVYFPARGRAELIRLVLANAGAQYSEEPVGGETLTALKETGKLAFNQVPYYEDEEVQLVQSVAISRYLATKYGFNGDYKQAVYSDILIDGWNDLTNKIVPFIYPTLQADKLQEFVTGPELERYIVGFERVAAKANGKFFGGDSPILGDLAAFLIAEFYVDDNNIVSKERLPLLYALKERVAAIPNIAAYISSEKRFGPWKIPSA